VENVGGVKFSAERDGKDKFLKVVSTISLFLVIITLS
jgi:hypothetical protein